MKILLIWPKARTDPEWGGDLGAIAEPLALEYLAAGVARLSDETRVLDLRLHPGTLAKTLQEFRPDVIGITAFSMHVRAALQICKESKALLPGVVTVVGGHHASLLPEDFFEPDVDHIVCGEGVTPFTELVSRYMQQIPVGEIKGVWSRKDGAFQFGGEQPFLDINSLPLPDRNVTAKDRAHYFIDWMTPVALLRTSVGCPFRCTFCSLWKIMDGKYLKRNIDYTINELKQIQEDFVFLVDDEAFIDGKRMAALAEGIKEAGIRKRFFAYCRVDSLIREKEVLSKWVEVGLERLFVGIDAFSEKDLDFYNKKYHSGRIEIALQTAKDLGIEILAQFVVNTNYTRDDFKHLVRFVRHHKIQYPTFTVLTPLPGTDMLKDFSLVTQLQPNGRPDWNYFDTQNAVMATTLPADEFRKEYRGLYHIFKDTYSKFLVHNHPSQRKPVAKAVSNNLY